MTINIQKQIIREVNLIADGFYADAKEHGQRAFDALTDKKRSQITGLESLANSTQKVSDVFNYVKIRTARQREWKEHSFGRELLSYMETTLAQKREIVIANLKAQEFQPGNYQQQEIYILLIRAFVSQLAAHYEYAAL